MKTKSEFRIIQLPETVRKRKEERSLLRKNHNGFSAVGFCDFLKYLETKVWMCVCGYKPCFAVICFGGYFYYLLQICLICGKIGNKYRIYANEHGG